MYAFTEPTEILFVSGEKPSSVPAAVAAIDGDDRTVTAATWRKCRELLGHEPPDCLLFSDSLDSDLLVENVRTVREAAPNMPIVAFIDGEAPIDRLFDAGVTDVVRSTVADADTAVIERRIEAARALTDPMPDTIVEEPGDEPTHLLREVTENISDVVWVNSLDEDGLAYVNSAYEEVWGRPRDHLYEDRKSLLETVHPEDREQVREAMEHQLEEPEAYDVTYRVVRPDGEYRWVHSRAVGVRSDGELERIVGVVTDITERKTHQRRLAAERDLIERILETSPVGIAVIDTSGTIVRANEQAGTILGLSKSTLEGGLYSPDGIHIRDVSGEELPDEEFPFNRITSSGEPLRDEQYIVERPDGSEAIISVDGVALFDDDSLERVVVTFDDVTEQAEREKRLEAQRDELSLLNHINRVIRGVDQALLDAESREQVFEAACDELAASDRYQFAVALQVVGERRLEATAFTEGAAGFVDDVYPLEFDAISESTSGRALETNETQVVPKIHDSDRVGEELASAFQDAGVQSLAVVPVQYDDSPYGTVAVYSPREDAFGEQERAVFDELGETVGHAIAAVESRQRERTLTSLYEATEGFLAAETQQEVSDVAVGTAIDVLDLPGIGIFLFDDETNLLAPVAGTDTLLEEFCEESQAFGPGEEDSITWHTYVTGEAQCFADVRESDRLASPDTSARAALFIPLGEHGVFVAASRETGAFTEEKGRLVGLLAATTEAALDRVAGQADIRERDAALEERTRQLERTEQLLSTSRDITSLVRDAKTRTALEEALCERLVEYDCVAFAWVGYPPSDGDELEPRTWAGPEDGYLDAISLGLGGDEPAVETVGAGQTTAVSNVTSHIRDQQWAREAIERGYQSVLAVPLAYGDTDYGVVGIYSNEPETFDETVAETAGEFGSTVAYGINSVETRRSILGERTTELDVHLGRTETLLNAVAAIVEEPVDYREMAPLDSESTQILFQLSDPPVEEILALESEFVAVESLTHSDRSNGHLFRATVSGETVATELLDCGGIPQEVTATPAETRATVRLSAELNVREFLDRLRERYPATKLRSRQDAEGVDDAGEIRRTLDEELTDRQREVLVTAYESGFFQSPRETTGEELAELLGVSQPTVTHHLREAQHRLFTALLDES